MDSIANKINADRAFFNDLGTIYPADKRVGITQEHIAGVSCYWFTPSQVEEERLIVYLHGGSFGLGSIQSHRAMVSHLASALTSKILFVEYSLAPEKPFPNAVNDVFSVYQQLILRSPKEKISLIGDSAGGGLAASFIHKAASEQIALPSCVVLISPWINLYCDTGSHITRKDMDKVLTKELLLEYAGYYANGNWEEADPARLNFERFPPLFILVGSDEILFDDSRIFYEKIRILQANCEMREYTNQGHVWLLADIDSASSKEALIHIDAFLRRTAG
ncbi:phosphinothricin tripeptide acetyl hydrolase [Anseongella ginsenosidimutans]|uniref:Phosphinothricin tripeptide acetyl hydrolase n=1 Tax=Anseongella ginsenosidimutans TaxID=496056 RepID=A0A4R3KPW3_9SPHI|nr:alpha/beta hydrolase [Anseongella ginsenosidimutans]QEC52242.1 alpha/beta hydrolase [Anseongella ginsenosidimutans]TCS86794.1 phosphinothricin tripeptide acetyl hydrolase [Anseongella ginsenosidimutans]